MMILLLYSLCIFVNAALSEKKIISSLTDDFPPVPLARIFDKSIFGEEKMNALNEIISTRNIMDGHVVSITSECWPYNVSTRTMPYETPEGKGLVMVERIGPIVSHGAATAMNCVYKGGNKGIMKGHVMFAVDAFTGSPLGYPPIHIHHVIPKKSRDFIALSSDLQCPDGTDIAGGWECLFQYYPPGYGSGNGRYDAKFLISVNVQDSRLENSPPLEYYIERISLWVTDHPQPPLRNAEFFNLGVWGSHPTQPHRDIFFLPHQQASVHMATFYFPTGANVVQASGHMHDSERESDELWLIRGTLTDIIDLGRARERYPSWFVPYMPTLLFPRHVEPAAMPAKQFLRLFGSDARDKFRLSLGGGASDSNNNSRGGVPPSQRELLGYAKEEVYLAIGGFKNQRLMCKFVSTVTEISRAHIFDAEKNGGRGLGPATAALSGPARAGWREGLYYRRANPIGPECDTFRFEANETFTLVAFNTDRPTWDAEAHGEEYPMHSTIKASVSLDDFGLFNEFEKEDFPDW